MTESLPVVATFWIGPSLRWFERIGLSSFCAIGHRVKLYCYDPIENVPEGVELCDAREIWEPGPAHKDLHLAAQADIFRLYLTSSTDEIWIDGDMLAIRPLTRDAAGYAVGWEVADHQVNNAVLGVPRNSDALALLKDFVAKPFVPPWLNAHLRNTIAEVPEAERLAAICAAKRSAIGPLALTWALRETKEDQQVQDEAAYYPIPWHLSDLFFAPQNPVDRYFTKDTAAVHLWSHLVRAYHRHRQPAPSSFLGLKCTEFGITV